MKGGEWGGYVSGHGDGWVVSDGGGGTMHHYLVVAGNEKRDDALPPPYTLLCPLLIIEERAPSCTSTPSTKQKEQRLREHACVKNQKAGEDRKRLSALTHVHEDATSVSVRGGERERAHLWGRRAATFRRVAGVL